MFVKRLPEVRIARAGDARRLVERRQSVMPLRADAHDL
jgi:hypothetical protein